MQTVEYFCPILTESVFSRHILIEVPSIKFHGNPSGGIRADTRGHTDGRDEANRRFTRLYSKMYILGRGCFMEVPRAAAEM